MADAQLKISIGGTVDPSLQASTQKAADQIDALNDTAVQSGAASNAALIAQAQQCANAAVAAAQAAANAIAALNKGTANNKDTKDQAKNWKELTSEISSAESQLVSDVLSKRQSLAADLQKIGLKMVESEISNTLKTVTQHELGSMKMLSSDKEASQEGLLYQLGTYLADQLGFTSAEAAKTNAKTAGVTQRNLVQAAGNATGLAQQAQAAGQVIESDAAQAASGAYSSASQIPYIGWIIGPIVAAAAMADVLAFAEGGQLRVGAAVQPTMLHKDEMVWPAWAAHGARNMLTSFSDGDFAVPRGGDLFSRTQSDSTTHQWNYAPTIQGVPERNVMDELRGNAAEFTSFIRGLSRGGSMRFA